MKLKNNRSGFTLLEIIIVIIIVGVLASLALPRLFNTVEYSRSTEALNVIGGLKRQADRCALAREATTGVPADYGNCITWDQLSTEDPGTVPGAIFTYGPPTYAPPNWEVIATRVGGTAAGDTITFTYDVVGGAITRVGNPGGAYAGLN